MEKITMADIAQLAGVTKSTVSRYFNGGYVRQETRERIQEVIKKYNYTPNTFARLKARNSRVVGVVVPDGTPCIKICSLLIVHRFFTEN